LRYRVKCCKGGYAILDEQAAVRPLRPLPPEIKALLFSDIKHFSSSSALYNRMMSIADTVIENGRGGKAEQRNGDAAYTVNGTITYYVRRDALVGRGGLSYFTFDGLSRLKQHGAAVNQLQSAASAARYGPRVQESYLGALFEGLHRDNPFCAELKRTGARIVRTDASGAPSVRLTTDLQASINRENVYFDVAAFTADNVRSNRTFVYKLKGVSTALQARHNKLEALVFPLLFWHADEGYNPRKTTRNRLELDFNAYMRARMLIPEPGWCLPCARPRSGTIPGFPGAVTAEPPPNPLNRFQLMSRLGQVYAVETVSRALDFRLGWHRHKQSTIFGTAHQAAISELRKDAPGRADTSEHSDSDSASDSDAPRSDAASDSDRNNRTNAASENAPEGEGDDNAPQNLYMERERETFDHTSPSFLADSFTGGPRHLKALAKNALVVVSQMGPPSAFITLTCNANDPAIMCRLLPGQSAFDRPEIVVQVWRAQLGAFLHNLRHGKYLGGKVKYLMYVIEYQVLIHSCHRLSLPVAN
jgi:hypothetical protein